MNYIDYSLTLVIVSILEAVIACYFVFSIKPLVVKQHNKKTELLILVSGGLLLGLSMWLMLYIGMLACGLPAGYFIELKTSVLSYLIAVISSIFSLWLYTRKQLSIAQFVLGVILVSVGFSMMQYTGIMALHLPHYSIVYDLHLVLFSILVINALTICAFALGIYYHREDRMSQPVFIFVIATVFALGIVSMHYLGLSAIEFEHIQSHLRKPLIQNNSTFILSLIVLVGLIFTIVFFLSSLQRRLKEKENALFSLNQQLENASQHDYLTKLPNRYFLNEHIPALLAKDNHLAFLHIDLDFFKVINDAYGHQVGDQLLQEIAQRISRCLFKNMTLIHLGGDEFLLLSTETRIERLKFIASRVLREINRSYEINNDKINISASLGIAISPIHATNMQELLINADIAMYSAKAVGGNGFSIYDPNTETQKIKARMQLLNELNQAISAQQFLLFYQPKYTPNGQLRGLEALIRWQHPKLGIVEPNYFIQMIENTGLIIDIGYWVIEQACQQIQQWERENKLSYLPVSINLSALQFEHPKLLDELQDNMKKYNIKPEHLMIEVTETTAMRKVIKTMETLNALSDLGILIAIDDFGTGYSSFAYLKDFVVNELKIDSGFMTNLESNPKQEVILASIIDLATKLGLTVTAEGVETAQQMEILAKLGCHQIQGYYFSKPVPVDELPTLVMMN